MSLFILQHFDIGWLCITIRSNVMTDKGFEINNDLAFPLLARWVLDYRFAITVSKVVVLLDACIICKSTQIVSPLASTHYLQ